MRPTFIRPNRYLLLLLFVTLAAPARAQLCTATSGDLTVKISEIDGDTYTFRVTNDARRALSFAAFELPDGVTAAAPAGGGTYDGRYSNYGIENPTGTSGLPGYRSIKFEANDESIKKGQTEVFEITLPNGTSFENPFRVTMKYANNTETVSIDPTTCGTGADLSLTKSVDEKNPSLNSNVTFTVTLTNAGPADATGVTVEDVLPAGLSFVSATPSTGSYNSGTGVWTVGSLADDATATLSLVAQVTQNAHSVTNVAQVLALNETDPDSTPDNDAPAEDDQDGATIYPQAADLVLTKTVDDATPNLGSTVTFTIQVANTSDDRTDEVIVEEALPAGLTYRRADATRGTYDAGTDRWTFPLNGGETATLEITAQVTDLSALQNTAEVISSELPDPDDTFDNDAGEDYDTASLDAVQVDLATDVSSAATTPDVGSSYDYTVTLTNQNTDAASEVVQSVTLPDGVTFVSATPSTGSYNDGTWTVGTVAGSDSETLTITVQPTTAGDKTLVSQTADQYEVDEDSTPGNGVTSEDDYDTATVTAQAVDTGSIGDLVFDDTDGDGFRDPGETGLSGVDVVLSTPGVDATCGTGDDVQQATQTTDGSGNYDFTTLAAGTYCVDPDGADVPSGYTLTTSNDPQTVNLSEGQNFDDADFGYDATDTASIGDLVFDDTDGDGVEDAGETGLSGVDVVLSTPGDDATCGTGDDVQQATQTTDGSGNYDFTFLAAGTYCVDPDGADVPSGYTLTTSNDPQTVNLSEGQNFDDADFGYDAAELPVELARFTALRDGDAVRLEWTTASETANAGFAVERADVDGAFGEIGWIDGAGTTTEARDYVFTDASAAEARASDALRYRLRQVDFDGAVNYSPVVEVALPPAAFVLRENYPDPFNPATTIRFALATPAEVTLTVTDALGRRVAVLVDGPMPAGRHTARFEAGRLPSGTYFYHLAADGRTETRSMILLR